MERILAMSLVGAGPGNVFGPGMSAGALESFFARDAGRAKAEGNSSRGAAAAAAGGGKRSASAGSGGKCTCAAADRTGEKLAANNGGASADVTRSCPAVDLDCQRFCLDAVVAPY